MSAEALKSPHQYTEIPERGRKAIEGFIPDEERIKKRAEHFAHVKPRRRGSGGRYRGHRRQSPLRITL